jgi:hypothetical protein
LEREALFLRSKNAPKIKKVPLKLYQIQDFPEIGIAGNRQQAPIPAFFAACSPAFSTKFKEAVPKTEVLEQPQFIIRLEANRDKPSDEASSEGLIRRANSPLQIYITVLSIYCR